MDTTKAGSTPDDEISAFGLDQDDEIIPAKIVSSSSRGLYRVLLPEEEGQKRPLLWAFVAFNGRNVQQSPIKIDVSQENGDEGTNNFLYFATQCLIMLKMSNKAY